MAKGRVPTSSILRDLAELQASLAALQKVRKDDHDLFIFQRNFNRFVNKLKNGHIPVTMGDWCAARNTDKGIKSMDVPVWWLRQSKEYFSNEEIGALLGVTGQAIFQRIKYAEERGEDISKPPLTPRAVAQAEEDSEWVKDIEDVEPFEVYKKALTILYAILEEAKKGDKSQLKPSEAQKALETALRYGEPKVLDRLQEKFSTLDSLGNWMLSELIPRTNTRIREIIREIEARIKAGEDTKFINFDLRIALRDCLPAFPELITRLKKEGWLKDEALTEEVAPE